jgi:hypothetical protein
MLGVLNFVLAKPPALLLESAYQWDDNLTVRVSLEVIRGCQLLADDSVVVDLTIDGKDE